MNSASYHSQVKPLAMQYGLAVLLALLASVLRFAFDPGIWEQLTLIMFLPAVAATAWFAGFWPAAFCATLGLILADFVFPDDRFPLALNAMPAFAEHLIYLVGSVLIIAMGVGAGRRQKALSESNSSGEWLAAIVSASNDAIVGKTLEGVIVSWNAGAERLFGYTASEAVGQSIRMIIPPELHDEESSILARLATGETVEHFETVRVRKDGRRVEISLAVSPVRDATGRVIGASKVARDITEERVAHRALRDSEERYRAVVESQTEMVCRFRLDGPILFANTACAKAHDSTPEALIGRNFWDLVPLEEQQSLKAALAELSPDTPEIRAEHRLFNSAGERWTLSTNRALHFDPSGTALEVQAIGIDITDHVRAEQALRESEQRFAQFMFHLPGLAWAKDTAGRYVYANDSAARAFRVERPQLYGRTDLEIFDVETAEHFRENDLRVIESASAIQAVETLKAADGTARQSLVSKFPIPDSDGRPMLVGGVAIDITERLRAEEALRESDRRKDEFLAVLGHELRNPLAPLRSGVVLLKQMITDPRADPVCAMMERQLAHLLRLVNDLLDVSRISRGKVEMRKAKTDLRSIVEAAVEQVRPLISERNHVLKVQFPNASVVVDADRERLVQVFANLLNNAAKFSDKCSTIGLRSDTEGGNVVVRVVDSGFGIPAEKLPMLFETFYQVQEHLQKTGGSGLGIGLALSQQIVSLHGGTIEARSGGLGLGSEFIVQLPLSEAVPQPLPELAGVRSTQRSLAVRSRRVLVVDDNIDSAESLSMVVEMHGHAVKVASDGYAALAAVESFTPEIVLLDIGLPQLDGYEVARRIRASPRGADIVLCALTGLGRDEDKRRAREAGFDEHMTKPVDFAWLAKVLGEGEQGRI